MPLKRGLAGHDISTTYELGWSQLQNGELLRAAEGRFEVFVTTDQNLKYQQNLTSRTLAILVLPTTSWPVLQTHEGEIKAAIESLKPGDYRELRWTA